MLFRKTLADMCSPRDVAPPTTLEELVAQQKKNALKGGATSSPDLTSTPSSFQMHGDVTLLASHQAMSDPTKMRELEDKIVVLTAKLAAAEAAKHGAEAARAKEEVARSSAEERERLLQGRLSESEQEVVRLKSRLQQANKSRANEGDLRHQNAMWSSLLMTQMNVDTSKFAALMSASRQVGSSSEDKGEEEQ